MNSIVKVKLYTEQEQREALLNTMLLFSKVCNRVSQLSFEQGKIKNKTKLQQAVYHQVKAEIPEVASQVIIRAISKVATSYQVSVPSQKKANERRKRNGWKPIEEKPNFFKSTSAVDYDLRLMSFLPNGKISLWSYLKYIKIYFKFCF